MSYVASSHTVNDVLTAVKRQFGDEAAIQVTDADIIRWINSAQDEIFRLNEPVKSSTTTALVAGQGAYTFPPGIRILRVQSVYTNGIPIPQRGVQEAEDFILDVDPTQSSTGDPQFWWEWAGSINLYPKPATASATGLRLNYIAYPARVTTGADTLGVPDVYYNRVLEYCMQQAYELDENFQAADVKAAQFNQNLLSSIGKDQVSPNVYPTITVLEEDSYPW